MTRIGLISDTHGWLDPVVFDYFSGCDEIWHGGDFGSMEVVEQLQQFKPLKAVFGNIDDPSIRNKFPEDNFFRCEQVNVFMRHIGGYPGRYSAGVPEKIKQHSSGLFISGHSHILKVMYDDKLNCLHINPGAAGNQGWHTMRTIIRFAIDHGQVRDCEVIELGKRGL